MSNIVNRAHLSTQGLAACVLLFTVLSSPTEARELVAYVGPGAGLTTIGALLAVLAMLALALLGPILYPIRLVRRWYRKRKDASSASESVSDFQDPT